MIRINVSLFAIAALVVVGLTAANLRRDQQAVALDWQLLKAVPKEVHVERPARGLIVQTINAPGSVEAVEQVKIAPQVVGRVVAVHVEDGDSVEPGDLLVKLEDTDALARLKSAEARIERLKASIARAEADHAQVSRDELIHSRLVERGVTTPTELADSRSAVAKAIAAITMCRQELAENQALLSVSRQDLVRTEIRAPIRGVVSRLDVEVGEIVIAGTTNLPGSTLMTISDPTRLRVRADVDETDLPLVRPGQPARVYLRADEQDPVPATVERLAPEGRKLGEVVSFETFLTVDGDQATLRPGMTATVEIEVQREPEALGVPIQAVVHRRRQDLPDRPEFRGSLDRYSGGGDPDEQYLKVVFVLEGGAARARLVSIGLSDERRAQVLSGVTTDESVITGPFRVLDELKDGQPVLTASGGDGPAAAPPVP